MPRLPDQSDIGYVTPQPRGGVANYAGAGLAQDTAAKGYGQISDALGQTAGLTKSVNTGMQQVEDANDRINYSTAYGSFLTKKLALDQQFANDQDYSTLADRYAQAVKTAATDSSAQIANVAHKAQFLDTTMRWQEAGINQMRSVAKARSVDTDRAYAKDYVSGILDQSSTAPDEPTRSALFDSAANVIDGMVQKGSMKADEGRALKQSLPNLFGMRKVKEIGDTSPETILRIAPGAHAIPAHPMIPGDAGHAINSAAQKYGVDPDNLVRTAQVESGGNPTAANPQSGAAGLFQFMPATARRYGVADPNDPVQSSDGAARMMADNNATLGQVLGRPPTGPELYLAHQQGASGATALLTNPDIPAVQALAEVTGSIGKARSSILENGGTAKMSSGDFVKMWTDKFNGAPGASQAAGEQDTGQAVPKMGDWRDFVRPDQWAEAVRTAQSRVDAQLTHQVSLQRYQDEQAAKALKDFQTTNDVGILADAAQGKPQDPNHIADMLRYRMVSEPGFKAWQSEMTRQGKGSDDASVVADLDRRGRSGEDIIDDVNKAVMSGSIKGTTGVSLVKAAAAGQQKADDRNRTDAFNVFKAATGGDTVEKGLIHFDNSDEVDRANRYTAGLQEFYKRVDGQDKEDPWAVVNDMLPRYAAGPSRVGALPRPRAGAITTLDDIKPVAEQTAAQHDAGMMTDDQYQNEQALIVQYNRLLADDQKRKEAAATAAKAVPSSGRKVLGVTPGSP